VSEEPTLATLTEDQLAELVADARAFREQPSLRTCLVPGCLRQYDAMSCMAGKTPPRPEWSGEGWRKVTRGPANGDLCPDHVDIVTAHLPRTIDLPNGRWTVHCACGWQTVPQAWGGLLRPLWEQHLLTATGKLPPAQPIPDPDTPGSRIPLAEHTDATLTELYDRLWDAEADREETRDTARSCILAYTAAVPALLGARTALEGLRARITVDSRDWSADKLDALLWAVLVGWNCENTDPGHVHDDIDCAGDQGLWDIARKHGIPTDQTIQASQHRWWIADAIKTARQIEDGATEKEGA
jgi:hypothetical protein